MHKKAKIELKKSQEEMKKNMQIEIERRQQSIKWEIECY